MDEFSSELNLNPHVDEPAIESSSEEEESSVSEEEEETSDEEQQHDDSQNFDINAEVTGIASLIALNQTYLDLIERLTTKIENLLENNREEQKKIKECLGNKKNGSRVLMPIYRAAFLPPYFKDMFNMIPSVNNESREISSRCSVNPLMKEEKPWSSDELKLLRKSVAAQMLETNNKELLDRRNYLKERLVNYQAQDGMEQFKKWKEELVKVSRRLEFLNSQDDSFALQSASYENVDWAKIAVREFKGSRSIMQLKMKWMFEQAPHWNKNPWTKIEDEALKFSGKVSWRNWDIMASKLDTKRTAFMCFERAQFLAKRLSAKKPWTTREDEQLISLVDKFTFENVIDWKKVASQMSDRSKIQCEIRYNRSLNPNLVRGRWTEGEDMLLIASVNKYGPHDWSRISQMVPGRTDVQCRARWVDHLDYKRSTAPWSNDEDEAILVGIKVFGRSNFSNIAKLIPGRNTSAVKIRIRTLYRWKIAMDKKAESSGNDSILGQIMENCRARPEGTLRRFNQLMEMSKRMTTNKHAFSLAKRLGYGNFVISNDEQSSDYTNIKQELMANFGKWFISKNGRWIRLTKNPNEFGEDELLSAMKDLPEEKRQMLKQFLNERDTRQSNFIKTEEPSEEQTTYEVEQAERIARLMSTVLVVEQRDIDSFNKRHQSTRFDPSKFSFAKINEKVKEKRSSKRQKMNANFSSFLHDLAPKRYTIADRVTDEMTYRINQFPTEERRNFILNLMGDMISQQMDQDSQAKLASLPKPILNVKILNYLHKCLSSNDSTNSSEAPSTSNNPVIDLDEEDSNDQDSKMLSTLKNLIIPSNANCNFLLHYKNILRPYLTNRAKILFPVIDKNFQPTDSFTEDNSFIDIQLPDEVVSDSSYQLLKERMMRLFLLPMLFKRALESDAIKESRSSVRELQKKYKTLQWDEFKKANVRIEREFLIDEQTSEPSTSNNERIIKLLNDSLPYKVFDPSNRKRFKPEEITKYDEVPRKRRRVQINASDQNTMDTVREVVSAGLKNEIVPSTSQTQPQNNTSLSSGPVQVVFQSVPVQPVSYRPRKILPPQQPPSSSNVNQNVQQTLSVRDYILMNQLPSVSPAVFRQLNRRN